MRYYVRKRKYKLIEKKYQLRLLNLQKSEYLKGYKKKLFYRLRQKVNLTGEINEFIKSSLRKRKKQLLVMEHQDLYSKHFLNSILDCIEIANCLIT